MANTELRLVFPTTGDQAIEKIEKFPLPRPADPEESRRLISAFWRIGDPKRREWLIQAAERLAQN